MRPFHAFALLDASLAERVKSSGAHSKAEDLLGLVESDCAESGARFVDAPRRAVCPAGTELEGPGEDRLP